MKKQQLKSKKGKKKFLTQMRTFLWRDRRGSFLKGRKIVVVEREDKKVLTIQTRILAICLVIIEFQPVVQGQEMVLLRRGQDDWPAAETNFDKISDKLYESSLIS